MPLEETPLVVIQTMPSHTYCDTEESVEPNALTETAMDTRTLASPDIIADLLAEAKRKIHSHRSKSLRTLTLAQCLPFVFFLCFFLAPGYPAIHI